MIKVLRFPGIIHPFIPAALLALIAVIMAVTATRWGIGVDNDSVAYLNLWIDPGLAPLLRWLHAAFGGLGLDIIVASRWLFIFLLPVNIVLVYCALYWATRSLGASFLGAILVFVPEELLKVHLMVFSEPLFLLFGLSGLLFLSRHLETENLTFLVLSAVAVALAFLSRFVGVALVLTGGISILLWSHKGFARRFLHSIIFATISSGPFAIYLAYRAVSSETTAGRAITINYAVNLGTLESIAGALARILIGRGVLVAGIPGSIKTYLVATAALLLIFLAVAHAIQWTRQRATGATNDAYGTLPLLLTVFIPCYLAVWLFGTIGEAHRGVGATVPIYIRHMVPVYFAGVLLAVLLVHKVLKPQRKFRFVYIIIVMLSIALTVNMLFRAKRWVEQASVEGLGYMSKIWRESELIKYVQSLDSSIRVYTNGIAPMLLYTRHNPGQAQLVPFTYHPRTGKPNSSYVQELDDIQRQLTQGKAVIVMFSHPKSFGIGAWHASEEELQGQTSLDVLWKNSEGGVYTARQ